MLPIASADVGEKEVQISSISVSVDERSAQTHLIVDNADSKRYSRARGNVHVVSTEVQYAQADFMNDGVYDSKIATVWQSFDKLMLFKISFGS